MPAGSGYDLEDIIRDGTGKYKLYQAGCEMRELHADRSTSALNAVSQLQQLIADRSPPEFQSAIHSWEQKLSNHQLRVDANFGR